MLIISVYYSEYDGRRLGTNLVEDIKAHKFICGAALLMALFKILKGLRMVNLFRFGFAITDEKWQTIPVLHGQAPEKQDASIAT